MKCPKCQYRQKRGKDGMVCKSCSYKFFFDPQKDKLTSSTSLHDSRFKAIINHASANGTYHFTPDQLFSSARHFGRESKVGCIIVAVVLLAAAVIGFAADIIVLLLFSLLIGFVISVTGIIHFFRGPQPKRKSWDRFVKYWEDEVEPIPQLIKSPALGNPPPDWKESDIYDYGVSGIILCDREETVDWLVLNQFHSQTNTLILTAAGYPEYLRGVAENILENKPDLPVHLLHDPGTSAKSLITQNTLPVPDFTDLGLDEATMAGLTVLRKRFGKKQLGSLPLDVIPYRTFSAALTHCLANGVLLGSILGANAMDSDTDISFG